MNLFNIKNFNKKPVAILFSAVTFAFLVFSPADALDISVGANTWYSSWEVDAPEEMNPHFNPGLLYGPILSARFAEDWSISSVFLYGSFTAEKDIKDIKRYDSDTSLNYAINKYFKVFAGFKYMGFKWTGESNSGGTGDGPGDGTHQGKGPGAGLALTVPLIERLYLLFNASGLYLWAKESMEAIDNKLIEKGINSTVSIAYYFPDISMSVALGYRYQYIKLDYIDNKYMTDQAMTFHGVTLSAVYSFNL